MPSLAIVQTAFIGDVVLATPLFEAARKSRPDDAIIAVVRPGCVNLLENNPFVDEIIVWEKRAGGKGISGILRLGKQLKNRAVGTALIPHRSMRTALALYLSGARTRIGFAKGGGSLFHTVRVPYRQGIHEVERNLKLAEAAGWETNDFKPSIFPDDSDRAVIDEVVRDSGVYCVFAPGSVWATKRWPVTNYVHVGNFLTQKGIKVVVSGGPGDEDICGRLVDSVTGALDTCGRLSLRQSAELYRRAKFVLTGDTAPQHIGAAMGTWVFSMFGPTIRDFGFWPYSERGIIIEENEDCRPCGIHGHMECREHTHRCMDSITYEKVIKIICETLEL